MLLENCALGNSTESLIRDQIICGTAYTALPERLLPEEDFSFEKTIQMRTAEETVKAQASELNASKKAIHEACMK